MSESLILVMLVTRYRPIKFIKRLLQFSRPPSFSVTLSRPSVICQFSPRQGANLQSAAYKAAALPIELLRRSY